MCKSVKEIEHVMSVGNQGAEGNMRKDLGVVLMMREKLNIIL